MTMRFDSIVFPGGKSKAFTLSYDDGVKQDRRLAELLRQYGLKCSFNLNSGTLGQPTFRHDPGKKELDVTKIPAEELLQVYQSHEIAGHGLYHSNLPTIGTPLAMYEIIEDKRRLEAISGQPLRMFAYPFGSYNDEVIQMLSLAGYQGARTVNSTHGFGIPENFLAWNPTCHHKDPQLMELAKQFVEGTRDSMLFYVWGHAYELDNDDNWHVIEQLAEYITQYADQIWFATNGEIMDYVNAYRRLEYSADGSMIRNPSSIDVTIRTADRRVMLPAGELTKI